MTYTGGTLKPTPPFSLRWPGGLKFRAFFFNPTRKEVAESPQVTRQ